jgi:hypothetical protein
MSLVKSFLLALVFTLLAILFIVGMGFIPYIIAPLTVFLCIWGLIYHA